MDLASLQDCLSATHLPTSTPKVFLDHRPPFRKVFWSDLERSQFTPHLTQKSYTNLEDDKYLFVLNKENINAVSSEDFLSS